MAFLGIPFACVSFFCQRCFLIFFYGDGIWIWEQRIIGTGLIGVFLCFEMRISARIWAQEKSAEM
jgi:hypothetical protein